MAEAKLAPNLPGFMAEHANRYLASGGTEGHMFTISVPGRGEITAPALRIVVVGDWGSGLPRACQVSKFMAQEIADAESAGLPVLQTELGSRVAYQEALAAGQGITTYAARDAGTREIFELLDELGRICHGQEASGRFIAQAAAR